MIGKFCSLRPRKSSVLANYLAQGKINFTSHLIFLLAAAPKFMYFGAMKTKVTKRGQVSVPSRVRKQLHIGPETTLEWVVEGATARVIPVPADPVRAFRGSGKKGLVRQLLKDRRQDREKEDASRK
jgi:AbrB family looped-hinge helix DNA binding protein